MSVKIILEIRQILSLRRILLTVGRRIGQHLFPEMGIISFSTHLGDISLASS